MQVLHIGAGFYRIAVKWNWISRQVAVPIAWFLFLFYIIVAIVNMTVFLGIPTEGGV